MIKVDDAALARKEANYPGFLEQLYCFEEMYIPPCHHCGSTDTASVQVGVIGRTIYLAWATIKVKLLPNSSKEGIYWCNTCRLFFDQCVGGDDSEQERTG